jgi:hypothetical protein
MMISEIVEAIQAHTEKVATGAVTCECRQCPRCHARPDAFRLHDRRPRIFLAVVGRLVRKFLSFVTRWRCPVCGVRFTDYPPFALPHKRYVAPEILSRGEAYLEDDGATYRSVVESGGLGIFHDSGDGRIDDRELAPSTVHRWISWLAGLPRTLQEALGMIRAMDPRSTIFRDPVLLPSGKSRSPGRKQALQEALRLLRAEREYRRLFGRSVFPELATGAGFG